MTDLDHLSRVTQAALSPLTGLAKFQAHIDFDRATQPAAIAEMVAEMRAWRNEAVAHQAFVDAFNASEDHDSPAEEEAHARWEAASQASRPYRQQAIDAARANSLRDCQKCGKKSLPPGIYCKGMDCPLNPAEEKA